ncbi:MAG: hypothetical protein ACI4FO_04520 [Acutalibacteraceae bacterium]
MKKPTKREQINLICSAFLVLGFGVCAYFFSAMSGSSLSDNIVGKLVYMLIFVLFGLILFYATRVGDGKQVKRFNISSLILVCLPALYVILAYMFDFIPLHAQIATSNSVAAVLAGVALGYGLPYTFLSGYELQEEQPEEEKADGEDAASDSDEADYSTIKTLDLDLEEKPENAAESTDGDESEDEAEQDNAADIKAETSDEISEDTAKTIESILNEKTDK